MKTKKKAIRRVTSVPPLESIELSSFDERLECHGLHSQPEAIVSGVGGLDLFLTSVGEASSRSSLGARHSCTRTSYREELMRGSSVGDSTFDVSSDCGCATPMFVDRLSENASHAAHVCTGPAEQTTGGEDISLIDGDETRVVPEHVPNTFTLCGAGPSSNETSQTSGTVRGNWNVGLERNNRRRRSQEAIVSGVGGLDLFLTSVGEASSRSSLGASHSCTRTSYREELMRGSSVGDSTFDISSDCGCATPMFVDRLSENASHAAHVCTGLGEQTTGGEDISLIDGDETRVVPEHVPNTFTLCGAGPSSNETSQTSGTVRGNWNVGLERNNRRRRSQVTLGSSSNAPRFPPNMRNRNRRSRQGATRFAGIAVQCFGMMKGLFYLRGAVSITISVAMAGRAGQVLRPDIVENLIELLDEHNELVQLFRTARDKIAEADVPEFKIRLFGVVGSRQHELPAGDSIGAIVFEGGPDVETEFDVVVEQHDRQLKSVNKLNASYMSMQFPLLFFR
ncbi:hypothetical protein CTI12_AA132100 [Artemisia annua]|uniref:Helitron helicase-like domain-containing protein n=1 Tax=Artemisia annua TaxID=35608 RepID=A0A2U1P0A5_ARTAN|nr:hypothetical protein CTI12_AA132100 [Artemisia annua]